MLRVIIASPYSSDDPETLIRNVIYAQRCMRDSLNRGEAPLASHLLYTQENILKDYVPAERALGMAASYAWMETADLVAFYVDRSWSKGMLDDLGHARIFGIRVEARSLAGPLPFPQELPR